MSENESVEALFLRVFLEKLRRAQREDDEAFERELLFGRDNAPAPVGIMNGRTGKAIKR